MPTYSNSRAAASPNDPSRTPISRTRARAVKCLRRTESRRSLVLSRALSRMRLLGKSVDGGCGRVECPPHRIRLVAFVE